jgi:pyruvate formate lyase activating enzyme
MRVGSRAVAVTAGYMCAAPRAEFYAHIDAANVDLKGFTERFYAHTCSGHLQAVLDTLVYLRRETDVWFEITNLLIPGLNDSDEELDSMTSWVVAELGPDVPMHFTAFHPDYKPLDRPPTPPETLTRARSIARRNGVRFAYAGNVHDSGGGSTYCAECGALVIEREVLARELRAQRRRPMPGLRGAAAGRIRRYPRQLGTPSPTGPADADGRLSRA